MRDRERQRVCVTQTSVKNATGWQNVGIVQMQLRDRSKYRLAFCRLFVRYRNKQKMYKKSTKEAVYKVGDLTLHYALSEIIVPH